MKFFPLVCILLIVMTGCYNLTIDPDHSNLTEAEYLSHYASPDSRGTKTVHFEPNDAIFTDELLEDQIKGKIGQVYPDFSPDVIVDGDRIIVSGLDSENEAISQGIRKAVGKLSEGRKLVIVTEDVFRMYDKSHRAKKNKF